MCVDATDGTNVSYRRGGSTFLIHSFDTPQHSCRPDGASIILFPIDGYTLIFCVRTIYPFRIVLPKSVRRMIDFDLFTTFWSLRLFSDLCIFMSNPS